MRRGWVILAVGLFGCSGHPDDGTVVEPGPGVAGVPGGADGISASRALPISGGTLLVAKNGMTAIAADPDRDRVWLVDLATGDFDEIALQDGDEPGRSVEDDQGQVHVALRGGGAVATINLESKSVVSRVDVCGAPRGIAHDELTDRVHVACQTGELVTLDGASTLVSSLNLGRDLRDVVVDGSNLLVSRFRSAELLVVNLALGAITATRRPQVDTFLQRTPFTAWRTVKDPNGGVMMLHQRGADFDVGVQSGGYASGFDPCGSGSIVDETISRIDPNAESDPFAPPNTLPMLAGPADFAVRSDGGVTRIALIATGNSWSESQTSKLFVMPVSGGDIVPPDCAAPGGAAVEGEPTAVAWDGQGRIVVQSREPAQIQVFDGTSLQLSVRLSEDSRADTGVALFHMNAGNGISCSSCHGEGGEDGRTWSFASIGRRRTQSLAGGVMSRAPFHWDGTLEDFHALVDEVFVSRMAGPRPNQAQRAHFASWLDTIPAPARAHVDGPAAERGKQLFDDPAVGCASCHSGAALTSNQSVDVGTGAAFQVPSLIGIAARAPFMHDGCAPTLRDRFGACGGDKHGVTSHLTADQLDDLIVYLESL